MNALEITGLLQDRIDAHVLGAALDERASGEGSLKGEACVVQGAAGGNVAGRNLCVNAQHIQTLKGGFGKLCQRTAPFDTAHPVGIAV